MRLEIELDLNKIDYDAINQQIQEKIATMDLKNAYQIESKIDYKIRHDVEYEVEKYLKHGGWYGELNEGSKREIRDEISKNIKELIKPYVENAFNQISQEKLNDIISELMPRIFMDLLTSEMKSMLANYYYEAQATILHDCECRFRDILGR